MSGWRPLIRALLGALALALSLIAACTGDTPSASPTPTPTGAPPTATASPTPTATAPVSVTRTATPHPTVTPIPVIQELPDRFTIQLLDFEPAAVEIRRGLGTLTATVDGVECTTVDLDTPEPPFIVIGTTDQPDTCRTEGAWVTLYAGDEGERAEHFRLHLGDIAQLGNYGPMPIGDGPNASPTPWTGIFEFSGVLVSGFEMYAFHPGACPTSLNPHWVSPLPGIRFYERVTEASGAPERDPFGLRMFHVRFNGELSAHGVYGHLGQYTREVIPHDLLSAELAKDCDQTATDQYRYNRMLWTEAAVTNYRFTFQRQCECTDEWSSPTTITVRDGVITSATVDGNPAPDGAALTVTDLFDEIANALNRPVATALTYDDTLGYPIDLQLDLDAIAVDGGLSLTITNFATLD